MLRRITLLAALAVSAFFGVNAAAANAASCTAQEGFTYWNGQLNFSANLVNCTGVDAVEFRNTSTYPAEWDDTAMGSYIHASSPTGILQSGGPGMTGASMVFSHASWCGGAAHIINTSYVFRIHNASTNTWGTLFRRTSPNYAINC